MSAERRGAPPAEPVPVEHRPLARRTEPDPLSGVRLVHVTTVPVTLGFLRGQVPVLRARGMDVHVLSSPGPELGEFAAKHGVTAHAVEMPRRITPLRDLWAVFRVWAVLRRVRPQVVHAHTPKGGLLGMTGAWLARVPVRVYHMRGLPLTTATGTRRRLLRLAERVSCALAHRVICVSHSLRQVALEEGLCAPDHITVLLGGSGQGVDAAGRFDPGRLPANAREQTRARLGIPAGARVLGFVGRLVREKGLVELAEAWIRLRERFPGLHLVLVGAPEPQDPVPAEADRLLRADSRVHFTGLDWNTPPLYAAMDLVAFPSHREGFPNVPLEAAAMRLPVVAARVAGSVDAVADGETGTLVPPRDAAALASALAAYLDDAELRARHGAAGRERVLRSFQGERIRDALFDEYARLLRNRGAAARRGG